MLIAAVVLALVAVSTVSVGVAPIGGAETAESMVAVGDMAVCGAEAPDLVSDLLDTVPGDILGLGDLAYPDGSVTDFAECFDPVFGRHKERFVPAVGNHEYFTAGAAGYVDYFGDAVGPIGNFYYAEQRGNWQIVVLNSNCTIVACGEGSDQYLWLASVLSSAPASTCRIVAMHHPRWSSYPSYADAPVLDPLVRLAAESGVDLVLSGHAHHYERFAQQDADQTIDPERGFRQFVVGTGGIDLRAPNQPAPNSEVRLQSHGVLTLQLEANSFSWEFLDTAGASLDSGSDDCVNAPATVPTSSTTTSTTTTSTTTRSTTAETSTTVAAAPSTTLIPLPSGTDPQLRRLYRAVFLREPDALGLAYWVDQRSSGRSLARIADFFAASPEFLADYGELDDAAFIERVYLNVLERRPDRGGRDYWIERLATGLSRGGLILNFSESPEFIAEFDS